MKILSSKIHHFVNSLLCYIVLQCIYRFKSAIVYLLLVTRNTTSNVTTRQDITPPHTHTQKVSHRTGFSFQLCVSILHVYIIIMLQSNGVSRLNVVFTRNYGKTYF